MVCLWSSSQSIFLRLQFSSGLACVAHQDSDGEPDVAPRLVVAPIAVPAVVLEEPGVTCMVSGSPSQLGWGF